MAVLSDPRLPIFRISTRMENGNDLNLTFCNIKKDSERKTPNHRASEISVYDGIQVRITNDLCKSFVDTVHELKVQVFALVRIPLPGLGEFGVRVGRVRARGVRGKRSLQNRAR